MRAQWPPQVAADDRSRVHDAICVAIVDTLVAAEYPHVGCSLTCTEVKWDDVTSSAFAFYRATRAAMTTLREQEKWSFIRSRT
jgi:hypothetical protein